MVKKSLFFMIFAGLIFSVRGTGEDNKNILKERYKEQKQATKEDKARYKEIYTLCQQGDTLACSTFAEYWLSQGHSLLPVDTNNSWVTKDELHAYEFIHEYLTCNSSAGDDIQQREACDTMIKSLILEKGKKYPKDFASEFPGKSIKDAYERGLLFTILSYNQTKK